MRKAYNDYGFIIENDVFIGVSLGYDFCAEHEWGVKGLNRRLGKPELTDKTIGIKARTMTVFAADCFHYWEEGDATMLISMSDWMLQDRLAKGIKLIPHDLKYDYDTIKEWKEDTVRTAWDEGSFMLMGKGMFAREHIKELYQAFKDKNVALAFMGGGVFANASMSFLIVDKLPDKVLQQMIAVDREGLDLQKIVKKLDLENKARKKGMDWNHFHAISPKFINYGASKEELKKEKAEMNTKYDVRVWVNGTQDQGYGWFSVEDVQDWIRHGGKKKISEYKKTK